MEHAYKPATVASTLSSPHVQQAGAGRYRQVGDWLMKYVALVIVCVVWMCISTTLILVNKHIMVDLDFPFPMAVSGMGMAFSGTASFIICKVLKIVEAKSSITLRFYVTHMLPVGFFMALSLVAGNHVYLLLSVAFIQMLKSFTPVMTMLVLFIARLESPTAQLIYSVLVICVGTALAAAGEVRMSLLGIACMLISEASEAIRLVITQILLQGHKFHPIEGLMWLAPACFIWLFISCLVFELPIILELGAMRIAQDNALEFTAAMCMGFGVNALAYFVIKLSSSLTLKVLASVKSSVLVLIGALYLQETVTPLQGAGYGTSVLGFLWYNKLKMLDVKSISDDKSAGFSRVHSHSSEYENVSEIEELLDLELKVEEGSKTHASV